MDDKVDVICNDCGISFPISKAAYNRKIKRNNIFRCPKCRAKYLSDLNKERLANRTPEERERTHKKMSEAAKIKNKRYWKNLSAEDRIKRSKHQSEINKSRWANMSKEERSKIGKNISKGQKNFWENTSDEFREDFSKKQSAAKIKIWADMSNEQRKEISKKRTQINLKRWAAMSNEERKLFAKHQREIWEAKSDEEKQRVGEHNKERWKAMTDDERRESLERLNNGAAQWRESLTPEDIQRLSEDGKARWNAMSNEDKERIALSKRLKWEAKSLEEKLSISQREKDRWNNLSEEEKLKASERGKQLWKSLSDEEKHAISQREKDRWANLPNDEKEAYIQYGKELSRKRKIWWDNLPDNEKSAYVKYGKQLSIKQKIWWENLSDSEKNKFRLKNIEYWNNLPIPTKEYYIHKAITSANGHNKFHQSFENQFYLNTFPLYLVPEYSSNNNGYLHSWDYAIFDYADNLICLVDLDGAYFHADICDYDGIHSKYEYDVKRGQSIPNNIMHCIIREQHFDEDMNWLLHILPMSYNQFIQEELKYLSAIPFPYPSYTDDELIFSWNKLYSMKINDKYHQKMKTLPHLGDRIVYHFCHSLYDELVWKPEWIEHTLRSHMIYHPHMNKNKLLMCVPHEEFTPPGQARILLKDHIGEYIDDKCDVGMMLGCIASKIPYRTSCANMARYNEIQSILKWMNDHAIQYDVKIK